MTLRRPAAHLQRAPGWRRSVDQSYWDGLLAEKEDLALAPRPNRPSRPRSAIEGGQLDHWLEHLQRLQKDLLRDPGQDQRGGYRSWRFSAGIPSSSQDSSIYGNVSSLGSQESLQSVPLSPPSPLSPECQGSWDRARIMHTPVKERAQLCSLPPVKIGWLPIQRRVTVAGTPKPSQGQEHPAGQVQQVINTNFAPSSQQNMHFFYLQIFFCRQSQMVRPGFDLNLTPRLRNSYIKKEEARKV